MDKKMQDALKNGLPRWVNTQYTKAPQPQAQEADSEVKGEKEAATDGQDLF